MLKDSVKIYIQFMLKNMLPEVLKGSNQLLKIHYFGTNWKLDQDTKNGGNFFEASTGRTLLMSNILKKLRGPVAGLLG